MVCCCFLHVYFPATTILRPLVYMPSSRFCGAGEVNRGRRTNNLTGCHPIRVISGLTSIIHFYTGCPFSTLPVYPGLKQTPCMLVAYPVAWLLTWCIFQEFLHGKLLLHVPENSDTLEYNLSKFGPIFTT